MALFAVVLCAALLDGGLAADKKNTKKLQIGVKKRVKDCKIRSTKGDTLHMHYTVSLTLQISNSCGLLLTSRVLSKVVYKRTCEGRFPDH